MLTPSQYKKIYENIKVTPKGSVPKTVTINKYLLAPGMVNNAAREAFLKMLDKRGIDTYLQIDTENGIRYIDPRVTAHEEAIKKHRKDFLLTGVEERELLPGASPQELVLSRPGAFREARSLGRRGADRYEVRGWFPRDTHVTDWRELAILVFKGKGSPEACQAVLQLANAWDLAPDVQAYADSAMGLDCNGFVGNYIWHIKNEHPWTELGAGNLDLGPDSPIQTGYFDHYQSKLLDRWEALDTTKMYIMMRLDASGNVINGGTGNPAEAGHLVITQPNLRDPSSGGDPKKFGVWVVEATHGHLPEGLFESWYTCRKNDSAKKIFTVVRNKMNNGPTEIDVKIAAIN